LTETKKQLDQLARQTNKSPEQKEEIKRLERQAKHLQQKATEQSETHSRKHKGQRSLLSKLSGQPAKRL